LGAKDDTGDQPENNTQQQENDKEKDENTPLPQPQCLDEVGFVNLQLDYTIFNYGQCC